MGHIRELFYYCYFIFFLNESMIEVSDSCENKQDISYT